MARSKEFEKEEVLDKAIQLFWSKGYNGASMQEVVDCLGLSRSSIYDTFGDKRKLFVEALEKYRKESSCKMIRMLDEATDPKGAIESVFKTAVEESIADEQHKGCFVVNAAVELAPHDKEFEQIVNQNKEAVENAFEKLIEKGQAQGQITQKQDAKALARFIYNNFSGIRIAAKTGTSRESLEDVARVVMSVLG
jgi:TetR/AcrR family transcriptional regulator, transcriptional repressor for nem operon